MLPNGKVLVAGGYDNSGTLASAELYDPASGTWTATGSLATARYSHTATLLPNGKVLVAGGLQRHYALASAELYDVGLGFSSAGSLRSASLKLTDGKRLLLTGSLFQGISQASGGNTQDSSSNYPIVQLRSIDNSQVVFAPGRSGRGLVGHKLHFSPGETLSFRPGSGDRLYQRHSEHGKICGRREMRPLTAGGQAPPDPDQFADKNIKVEEPIMYSANKLINAISFIGGLAFLTLSPTARAVDPPPDGGYPNFNTAEGEDALFSLTAGTYNTAIGYHTLFSNTEGYYNTASGAFALLNNTFGAFNTATGFDALLQNTTGGGNTASGWGALEQNTTGFSNTAMGYTALEFNSSGNGNTATGLAALRFNNGSYNTANGMFALTGNTTGSGNTANGYQALNRNSIGNDNTANGYLTLSNNIGDRNTASGFQALSSNTIGDSNTADGDRALFHNKNGANNTAVGAAALFNDAAGNNTAVGAKALAHNTTGRGNIALGITAGADLDTGDNNVDIGNRGVAGESNTVRIGAEGTQTATFIAGISGKTVAGGVGVIIDTSGHLGTVVSSERFKDAIKPMDEASEAILSLQPVTFRYKKELDPHSIPQFGLVAEQVEKVDPNLVARDEEGKVYTVRYEAVNAMLLNEFLKAHRKIAEQSGQIAKQDSKVQTLEATVARLELALKAQETQIQRVSEQIKTRAPAPRVVADN